MIVNVKNKISIVHVFFQTEILLRVDGPAEEIQGFFEA